MDIDLDTPTTFNIKELFPSFVRASVVQRNELTPHACGYYCQHIPIDNITKLAAIPYDQALEYGYRKIDFLHLSLYDKIESPNHLKQLQITEPNWNLLQDPFVLEQLSHLGTKNEDGTLKHFKMIQLLNPKSIEDVADCLALIRPSKQHLLSEYINNKQQVRGILYDPPASDQYYFKKSHAIAYAHNVVVELNIIKSLSPMNKSDIMNAELNNEGYFEYE
mgnify:CR=1 FL=1